MKVDLGTLFNFYISNTHDMDFDSYVDKYKNDEDFREKVNNEIPKYEGVEIKCDK